MSAETALNVLVVLAGLGIMVKLYQLYKNL